MKSKQINNIKEILFYNSHLKSGLLIYDNPNNQIQNTPFYNYSKVSPTPITNERLLKISSHLCDTLDFSYNSLLNASFSDTLSILSGNQIQSSSFPISHCYSGYQFGYFAGQLGDGRAITLGDFFVFDDNSKTDHLWELQLKGSGKTPYSRFADGRAVLRSSIREFLASEYLYQIGVPTTRALSLISSDTTVLRDLNYNGKVRKEQCAVVSRLCPSFIRFGSFEIFIDSNHSFEKKKEMIPIMMDYLLMNHYNKIENKSISKMIEVLIKRTAVMVASWEMNGFCHGVLNTDNMSIIGVTIDYGPYGINEYYDDFYVPNSSDKLGRYSFISQRNICKWNLHRLVEAIESDETIRKDKGDHLIDKYYNRSYDLYKSYLLYTKLGFLLGNIQEKELSILINDLFNIFNEYCIDLIGFYRNLSKIQTFEKNLVDRFISQISKEMSQDYDYRIQKLKPLIPKEKIDDLIEVVTINPTYFKERGYDIDEDFLLSEKRRWEKYGLFMEKHKSKEEYNENKQKDLQNWTQLYEKVNKNEYLIINSKDFKQY